MRLTPAQTRLMIFGWLGLTIVGGVCTFLIIFIALGFGSNTPAASPTQPPVAVSTLPAMTQPLPNAPSNPSCTPPADNGVFALGGHMFAAPSANPTILCRAGMSWMKYQIKWDAGKDPTEVINLINEAHTTGFKVLISVPGQSYPQTTIDYVSYIAFLGQIATAKPDAIEVWNEMNLDREWPAGQIDPAAYTNQMLKPAYETIKAASPNTMVIIGALAPTGADDGNSVWADDHYSQGLAQAGAAQYADCVGVHHNSGTTAPSAAEGHPYDSGNHHYSWYFQPTINVYHNAFPSLKICLTEFGYLTGEGFTTPLPEAFAWGAGNTLAEQAQWLGEGVTIAKKLGYVRLVIVWNVDSTTWDTDPQAGFAILRPDGSCPACDTLAAAMSGN
jgi:hypothetical protein